MSNPTNDVNGKWDGERERLCDEPNERLSGD